MTDSILRRIAFDPDRWIAKADALFSASMQIRPKVDEYWHATPEGRHSLTPFLHAYFMLIGFAIENCLKAMVIMHQYTQLTQQFEENERLPGLLQKHDLPLLFTQAGLTSNGSATKALLSQLTRWTIWESRYPVPLNTDAYHKPDTFQIDGYITASAFQSGDKDNVVRLFDGLIDLAKKKAQTFQEHRGGP